MSNLEDSTPTVPSQEHTPIFRAENEPRYIRQEAIRSYERDLERSLVVFWGTIIPLAVPEFTDAIRSATRLGKTQLRPPRRAAVGCGVRPKPKRRNAHRELQAPDAGYVDTVEQGSDDCKSFPESTGTRAAAGADVPAIGCQRGPVARFQHLDPLSRRSCSPMPDLTAECVTQTRAGVAVDAHRGTDLAGLAGPSLARAEPVGPHRPADRADDLPVGGLHEQRPASGVAGQHPPISSQDSLLLPCVFVSS